MNDDQRRCSPAPTSTTSVDRRRAARAPRPTRRAWPRSTGSAASVRAVRRRRPVPTPRAARRRSPPRSAASPSDASDARRRRRSPTPPAGRGGTRPASPPRPSPSLVVGGGHRPRPAGTTTTHDAAQRRRPTSDGADARPPTGGHDRRRAAGTPRRPRPRRRRATAARRPSATAPEPRSAARRSPVRRRPRLGRARRRRCDRDDGIGRRRDGDRRDAAARQRRPCAAAGASTPLTDATPHERRSRLRARRAVGARRPARSSTVSSAASSCFVDAARGASPLDAVDAARSLARRRSPNGRPARVSLATLRRHARQPAHRSELGRRARRHRRAGRRDGPRPGHHAGGPRRPRPSSSGCSAAFLGVDAVVLAADRRHPRAAGRCSTSFVRRPRAVYSATSSSAESSASPERCCMRKRHPTDA